MLKYRSSIVFILFSMPYLLWGFDANSAFDNGNTYYEKEQYNEAKQQYLS